MSTTGPDRHMTPIFRTPLHQHAPIERLAVFRALQLGDMLCVVPALRALRAVLPGTRIMLVGLPWAEQFAQRFHRYIDDFTAFPGHPEFPEQTVREELLPVFYETMQAHASTSRCNCMVTAASATVS